MVDELTSLWSSLQLSDGERAKIEVQAIEVKKTVKSGQSCIVGKLVSDRIVSKETIKDTLLWWWRLGGAFTFKVRGDNLFLIEFKQARDKARVLEGRPWVF